LRKVAASIPILGGSAEAGKSGLVRLHLRAAHTRLRIEIEIGIGIGIGIGIDADFQFP
jgi:hypothetical protein